LNTLKKIGWGLGLLMLAENIWKQNKVIRFFQQPLPPPLVTSPRLISVLQTVLSGDPTMSTCLECSLQLQSAYRLEFIWLLDEDDQEGQRLCQELITRYPALDVRLIIVPTLPEDCSPKTFKLIEGRRAARGDIICVLDDDTMLPENALDLSLPYLDQPGIGLAFGLPYYVNFSNTWSSMVSTFVNSNSLLTYIPYTVLTEPFTINGMFYVMRAEMLDSIGGFAAIKHLFADDFAIAHLFRTHGYKLAQTPVLHAISTQVRDVKHYFNLLQRWFIFPRESILRHVSWRDRSIVYALAVVPSLFPLLLLLSLSIRPSWQKLAYTLLYFGCNTAIINHLNEKYLQRAQPREKAWLVPVMQLLTPIQIVIALCSPQRTNWRGHIVKVERGGTFRYVRRRTG
jgi:ceramide glucosyltransferase